ncbi:hypothetical protein [Desertihabitans aurantiacus]|uniref:hypothetical protein n=1 Tax=Desertihabitans aurantiacus TaxID=2282477 RepID=UPI001300454E|nr:hypothetical protein [Desertihabitans aurantiacus]
MTAEPARGGADARGRDDVRTGAPVSAVTVARAHAAVRRWRWVAMLLAGVLTSLVLGFLVGLARPRTVSRP